MQVLRQLVGAGEPIIDGHRKVGNYADIGLCSRCDELVFGDRVEKEDALVQEP